MAMETEAKIAALLSLLAVLLLHTLLLQPPRPRVSAATLITDHLLSTLEFDGRRLVDLVTRRNMMLLCHAILLIILKDAGLLATPARRCVATTSTCSTASAAAGGGASSKAQPQARMIIVMWPNKAAKNATIADSGQLKRERRGPRPAKATARRALPWTEAAATEREETVVQELPLVERSHSSDCFNFDRAAVREIVPVEDKSSCFYSEQIADHEERNRGEEDMAREETEVECSDDCFNFDHAAVREIVPVEDMAQEETEVECSDDCFNFDHAAVREIVPVEDKSSCFYSEQIADHEERNRGEEDMAREETEAECSDDVDEMNKRFEEFIANMRRQMQLEEYLQLVMV